MNGILLIDKPKNWTSFDVVAKTRGVIRRQTGLKKPKVGHAGTLDPMATGLLVLLIGTYCKQAQQFLELDKAYQATLMLGATSTTGDTEGAISRVSDNQPSNSNVEQACKNVVGTYEQMPPIYSAKKVDGKRAYQLAREGKSVALEPKQVTVYDVTITRYMYPELHIMTTVSSGTYLRSLAVDIGNSLKTGAYLADLRRTRIGNFQVTDAITVDDIALTDDITKHIRQAAIDIT